MAISNKERIGRILTALQKGLGAYILREFKYIYTPNGYVNEIGLALERSSYQGVPSNAWQDEEKLLQSFDAAACLNLMWRRWNDVFQEKLGHNGRSYVSELLSARNNWAHQGKFTNDEAYRVADTAARLLKMISAAEEVAYVEKISQELLRLRFEQDAEKSKKEAIIATAVTTTAAGLRPWRDIIQPHPDVASGRYVQAEFAADLAQVISGTAQAEYQDAVEFFKRTYLTEGLQNMLVTGVKRLTAQGGDPVIQLQTSFGGGKTHSMLALYHLVSGKVKLADFPDGEKLSAEIGNIDLPEANTAVLVGTALDPTKTREYENLSVHTLWGEMAYQLGGKAGYEIVREADTKGVSPGSDTLTELFFKFGPCLIIIDELVAYARNIYNVEGLPSGSFESVMTFMQALTESIKRSEESMLLISIPESDIEVGGKAGKDTLNTLSHIVGRIEAIWKPVTSAESFEIVRRRLFASEIDYAARDAVVNAFGNMYRNASGEFPAGVAERDYLERMKAAYPIHPELFDRLYQDWSTLERFQRTRGVLSLMAAIIHQLWTIGDQSLLILPGTLPEHTPNQFLRYLPDAWNAIYETDVDGKESEPFALDANIPNLGRYFAARRVARTIFVGSAPSVTEQNIRGLEEVRIRLGCAQPGEPTAVFGDALRRLVAKLSHLYSDDNRYWYDTQPTVNKLARDRAQSISDDKINEEITEGLRAVPKTREFAAFHVAPRETSDVVDSDQTRVIVLSPDTPHKRTNGKTIAEEEAKRFLESRGTAQRLHKNMLVFIAPDDNDMQALKEAIRESLAWQSIHEDREEINLDAQQRRQVKKNLSSKEETVKLRLRSAYNWLLVPVQPEPMGAIEIRANRISGDDNFYDRASRKLHNDGLLITKWSPDILRMELERYVWNDERGWEISLKELWGYLTQYCYFPRLLDKEVLLSAVSDGIERLDAPLAYATGKNETGHHTGIVFQSQGNIYFDENSLLIHPNHLSRPPAPKPPQVKDEAIPDTGATTTAPTTKTDTDVSPAEPSKKQLRRYYGRVSIDPQRVNKDIGVIVEEVIERLTSQLGSEVEITLEIQAKKKDGFEESTIRTISENSRTLKFEDFGFEEG